GLAATGMLLTSYILMPLLGALVAALLLGLLGDAVIGRELSWRRALSRWPTFAALALAGRLLPLILPAGLIVPLMPIGAILFGLLPYAVGVLGLPLMDALRAAPALLWGRIGTWIRLGLATMLITFAATGVWQLCNRSPLVALVFYPALGTALVAAAAALCLDPEETASRTPHPLWMLPLVLLTVGGAWLGAGWIDAWAGWQPSREAALARDAQPPFMFGSERHTVLRVIPDPGGELVISRVNSGDMLALNALRRGRFGWQFVSGETWPSEWSGRQPGVMQVSTQAVGDAPDADSEWLVVGELFDNRVAYLQIGKDRFPVGQDGPIFVVRPGYPPNPPFAWLDANGQPVPEQAVTRP
ncbi:MAG: hypothetical protein JWN15_3948, partial [Firmicutes bacterium]|nr:hypothetical protein [Bacillota bacterium]